MGCWNIMQGFLPNAYIYFRPHLIPILKILTRQTKWNQTINPSKKEQQGRHAFSLQMTMWWVCQNCSVNIMSDGTFFFFFFWWWWCSGVCVLLSKPFSFGWLRLDLESQRGKARHPSGEERSEEKAAADLLVCSRPGETGH